MLCGNALGVRKPKDKNSIIFGNGSGSSRKEKTELNQGNINEIKF